LIENDARKKNRVRTILVERGKLKGERGKGKGKRGKEKGES